MLNSKRRNVVTKLTAATLVLVTSLTGCGSSAGSDVAIDWEAEYATLDSQYSNLQSEYSEMSAQVSELTEQLKSMNGVAPDNANGVDSINLPSDYQFNEVGSRIQFQWALKYPTGSQAPNTSKVQLYQGCTIDPSNNWIVQMDGTTTRYNHPQGISGEIAIQIYDDEASESSYEEEIMGPFIELLNTTVDPFMYSIFVDDRLCGKCSTAIINIDNNEAGQDTAILKFGILGYKGVAISYCFYYDGKMDRTKTELVDSLIRSIRLNNGAEVRIDS